MATNRVKRQKFLKTERSKELEIDLLESVALGAASLAKETDPGARGRLTWGMATESLELLILRYTAGFDIHDLRNELPQVIQRFDEFVPLDNPPPHRAYTFDITQEEAYVYIFWLLSLCQLLGHPALCRTVLGWLDRNRDFNRGRDGLFEAVCERLTGEKVDVERVLLHPDAYRPLAKASAPDAEDRPALVKEFLDGWYKNMKGCYWHGTHTDGEGSSYFGYWAFEAALVTYLWDIDDSSYRDHLVYPKDLVDHAREHFPYTGPSPQAGPDRARRCEAGQPCPQAGWWSTPAKERSRQRFEAGEVMPAVAGDYGATIWQWDVDQES